MIDLNKVILIGRTTRDFELKYTPAGTPVASTSFANGRSTKNSSGEKVESVSYFDIVVWNKLAEIMTEYVKKGNRIAIEGRLTQRKWKDQDDKWHSKVEIAVETFQFLTDKKSDESKSSSRSQENDKPKRPDDHGPENYEDNPFSDEDVPF